MVDKKSAVEGGWRARRIRGARWARQTAQQAKRRTQRVPATETANGRGSGFLTDPPWWFRDLVIAALVGLVVAVIGVWAQRGLDDERSARESQSEDRRAEQAIRVENLRFVRDRSSSDPDTPRPFRGLDLRGQELGGLELRGADFSDADLTGASLAGADLRGANFWNTTLTDADLNDATLHGAEFRYTKLAGANFEFASLGDAVFVDSEISKAKFDMVSAVGTTFEAGRWDRDPPRETTSLTLLMPSFIGAHFYGMIIDTRGGGYVYGSTLEKTRVTAIPGPEAPDLHGNCYGEDVTFEGFGEDTSAFPTCPAVPSEVYLRSGSSPPLRHAPDKPF